MGVERRHRTAVSFCLPAVILILFSAVSISGSDAAAASAISSAGARSLLQAPKSCPLDFEMMDYTVLTSQCRAPEYNATKCCQGFRDFACPLAKEVNDFETTCARVMFSYINSKGNYPGGLFDLCFDSKEGISCPMTAPPPVAGSNGGAGLIAPAVGSAVLFLAWSRILGSMLLE